MSDYTHNGNYASEDSDAIVVGAGFSGLYQVYRLREMGLRVLCLEAAPAVGGTWYWNCYPGARVDSEAKVYQYWFSDELIDEWDWSERFPAQPETERYLNYVADKFDLRRHIQFDTRVNSAEWDEAGRCWLIGTEKGEKFRGRYFVSCAGVLSVPKIPDIPGAERFDGTVVHTARYPREGLDLKGKRVGVVGCGATGVQVIQTIAAEVAHLTAFQRTPCYGIAIRNDKLDDATRAQWRAQATELRERVHHTFVGFQFDFDNGSWYDHTPEERRAVLEQLWADGSLAPWVGSFPEVFSDEEANAEMSEFAREKIRAQVKDPEVAEMLTPRKAGFGTYRVPLESGYYEAFNRDNVTLVDASETPIRRYTENGLETTADHYDLDIVILATGFDASTGALTRMNIRGRDGRSLTEEWQKDVRSTLGLLLHGFPNLFTLSGPLAPSAAFCNAATCLQQQVDWVTDCIAYLVKNEHTTIEPTLAKQDEWVALCEEQANETLLSKTESWYMGANIEGKPRRLLGYLGVGEYQAFCEAVKSSGYAGFELR
jgi:acetone monooxygenase